MTDEEIRGIARLCWQEQGSVAGAAAEASLASNCYRMYGEGYDSLYKYMRYSGWWANAAHYMDNGNCPEDAEEAVRQAVLGLPTLPLYIDEHDCFTDIETLNIGGVMWIDTEEGIRDRKNYIRDKTIIYNKYGAAYTFYCFPGENSDPFGYTHKPVKYPADDAALWMETLAQNDLYGYDQEHRWGERGDYDCSSAIISAYEATGIPVKSHGASYTGDMRITFKACGFVDVTGLVDLATGKGLQRGDVLLNEAHHTAMYVGDGLEAEASINEKGEATGGKPGDQTGNEILVRAYRNFPWDCVLRYHGGKVSEVTTGTVKVPFAYLETGCKGDGVRLLQAALNIVAGADLEEDGEFGELTRKALMGYQSSIGAKASGRVNKETVRGLLQDALLDTYTIKTSK